MEQTLEAVSEVRGTEGLDRAWWAVVALFLVHGLVVSTWVSRIATVKAGLGLSDGAFGLALFGAAVGALVAIPCSGWAIHRYGSKKAVQWTAMGFCVSLVLLAWAPSPFVLFAALFVYGAMTGANDVAINAQGVAVEKQLGRPTMSRFHAMFSLGGIAGAGLGGFVAAGGIPPMQHFTVAAVLIAAIVIATMPAVLDHRQAGSGSRASMYRRPPAALLALSGIGFCIFLSEGAIADWTTVYLKEILHAGEGTAAAGYALFSASMTVFRLAGDVITARLGRAWTIRSGGLLAAGGMALVVVADSVSMALSGFAVAGAGFSSIIPLVFAAGGRVSPANEAAGIATVSGIGYMGFLIGPPMIGFVSEMSSLRAALGLLVVLSAAAALLVGLADRRADGGVSPLAE